jgi:hypothetical protein
MMTLQRIRQHPSFLRFADSLTDSFITNRTTYSPHIVHTLLRAPEVRLVDDRFLVLAWSSLHNTSRVLTSHSTYIG